MKFVPHTFFFVLHFVRTLTSRIDSQSRVTVTNDGPAVLGANITFDCVLDVQLNFESDLLSYTFSDGIQLSTVEVYGASAKFNAFFSPSQYRSGFYNMSVSVKIKKHSKFKEIGTNYTTFQLTDYLNGKIVVWQEDRYDVEEVAIKKNCTFFIHLYDPSGYLSNAEIDFKWSVDHDRQPYPKNNLSYTYGVPGNSHIMSVVVAKLNNGDLVYGYFKKSLTVEVPVFNVSYLGNPFIPHGDMLHLNISCKGSWPFAYCHKYFTGNETVSNFTCPSPVHSNTCAFQIQLYIQHSGTSHIGIFISNDVSIERKFIEVYVYNVSKKPQLSVVIIPIVCSLMTLVIIVGGITYCVHQRSQLFIEVANFDFQDDSDSYVERTFFEKLLDPLMCRTCNFRNRRGSECSETLSETAEPLLSCESPRPYS